MSPKREMKRENLKVKRRKSLNNNSNNNSQKRKVDEVKEGETRREIARRKTRTKVKVNKRPRPNKARKVRSQTKVQRLNKMGLKMPEETDKVNMENRSKKVEINSNKENSKDGVNINSMRKKIRDSSNIRRVSTTSSSLLDCESNSGTRAELEAGVARESFVGVEDVAAVGEEEGILPDLQTELTLPRPERTRPQIRSSNSSADNPSYNSSNNLIETVLPVRERPQVLAVTKTPASSSAQIPSIPGRHRPNITAEAAQIAVQITVALTASTIEIAAALTAT